MKSLFILLLCSFLFTQSFAQKTSIKGHIPSMKGAVLSIKRPTQQFIKNVSEKIPTKVLISQSGDFSIDASFLNKEIAIIAIQDTLNNKDLFEQYFFISKGDNLVLTENANKGIDISGIGAKHNQLREIPIRYTHDWIEQDSIPDRIFTIVNGFYEKDKRTIDSLVKIHKPSTDFIEAWKYHLKYARLNSFYTIPGEIRIERRDILERNKQSWVDKLVLLQNEATLSDEKALVAPSYHGYLNVFIERKFTDLVDDYFFASPTFYQEWFDGDTLKADEAMRKDSYNQLKHKIIEKYFDGKVKEQMYAFLFDQMILSENYTNLEPILNDFNRQFPNSKFNAYFEAPLKAALEKLKNKLTDKMLFLNDIKNWDTILAHFKGKTVLLDMWGTWCAPCREDLNLHAAQLKKHFKDKDVSFLYIANYDNNKEKLENVIAFYNLEGSHIQASRDLTTEIMQKINAESYPTYVIIDKYGKVELSRTQSPMQREALIQQIEEVLRR